MRDHDDGFRIVTHNVEHLQDGHFDDDRDKECRVRPRTAIISED